METAITNKIRPQILKGFETFLVDRYKGVLIHLDAKRRIYASLDAFYASLSDLEASWTLLDALRTLLDASKQP